MQRVLPLKQTLFKAKVAGFMKVFFFVPVLFASSFAHASFDSLSAEPRILVIGDSHSVGPFGRSLADELRKVSPKSSLYASCGTVASSWFTGSRTRCGFYFRTEEGKILEGKSGNTPKISGMIQTLKPDLLVVQLAGNYSVGFDESSAVKDMRRIVELIKDLPIACLWIAAPDARVNTTARSKLYSWVASATGDRCTVLDSRAFTRYPEHEGDGIHYSRESDVR
ncbi:MAG: hypothetical protein KGP28_13050, partial [Bdellovibrionales bacterium]|nr:hypothetical protein [Bdellovibrionales bacterium]